jgi:predicted transcriptional regulator
MSLVRNTHDDLVAFADKAADLEDLAYSKAGEQFSKRIAKVQARAEHVRNRIALKIDKGIAEAHKQAEREEAALCTELKQLQKEYDRMTTRLGEIREYIVATVGNNAETVMNLQNLKNKHDFIRVD